MGYEPLPDPPHPRRPAPADDRRSASIGGSPPIGGPRTHRCPRSAAPANRVVPAASAAVLYAAPSCRAASSRIVAPGRRAARHLRWQP